MQLPIWLFYAIIKQDGNTILEKITKAFQPTKDWGPIDPILQEQYKKYVNNEILPNEIIKHSFLERIKINLLGK